MNGAQWLPRYDGEISSPNDGDTIIWSFLIRPRSNYWNHALTGALNIDSRFHHLMVVIEHQNLVQANTIFFTVYRDLIHFK